MNAITKLCLATVLATMVGIGTCEANPLVHWASDPVLPGETVLIVGEHLDRIVDVTVQRVVDDASSDGATVAGERKLVSLRLASESSLAFTVPKEFSAGVYRVVVTTQKGQVTRLINAPVLYWMQGDRGSAATRGGWIRVFGRDIARTQRATLRFSQEGKPVADIEVAAADLWDGRFDIPSNFVVGRYELTLWNGNGDKGAVVPLGAFDILPEPSEPTTRKISLAASTSAQADDTRRIQEALLAMGGAGGGTVHLSRGAFTISARLDVPPHVSLQGDGMDLTTIVLASQPIPPDAVISGRDAFTVGNLTIAAGKHAHIIRGGFDGDSPIPEASDIVIENVRIRASLYLGHLTPEDIKRRLTFALGFSSGGPDALRLSGSRLRVVGCDILSSGRSLFIAGVRDGMIAGNRLFNGRYGWYSISVSRNVIIENNDILGADLQSTGGGINTMFGSGDFASRNILVKNNHFARFFGWDREAMTSDGGGGCYAGPVDFEAGGQFVRASAATSLPSLDRCRGGALMVLDGTGRGTIREIRAGDDTGATLDEPMVDASDAASFAVIGSMQRNYLIIGNTFEDTGALQFFGTSIDHVIADNTFVRSDGIFLRALRYKELQPILYVQILNNRILTAPPGRIGLIQIRTQPPADLTVPLVIGAVVRGNALMSNSGIEIRGSDNRHSGAADLLVENNHVSHVRDGISLDRSAYRALVTGNVFDDVVTPVADQSQH